MQQLEEYISRRREELTQTMYSLANRALVSPNANVASELALRIAERDELDRIWEQLKADPSYAPVEETATVNVVVIKDDVVDSLLTYPDSAKGNQDAEIAFQQKCSECLSNWSEYTPDDVEAILTQGYEKFGNGSICLVHSEN